MKIKEVEESIGITSKNIRFYEKEDLVSPERDSKNGYREYSNSDINELKIIKIFRKLGISIEDIRLLKSEESLLKDALEKQINNFKNKIDNLNQAKGLCIKMKEENISFKEVDADLWLFEMRELESKGVKFMNINNDEIIRFLPDKFKIEYYESIIKNGQIDNTLLEEIIAYFGEVYKKKVDNEKLLMDALKNIDSNERAKLLLLVKENNSDLYHKISRNVFDFEDIVTLDKEAVKSILEQFNIQMIIKASMAASPKVNEYLQTLFHNIDFVKERQAIGSIPINEAMNIHDKIIEAINRGVWE